jgi:hypothetical protein
MDEKKPNDDLDDDQPESSERGGFTAKVLGDMARKALMTGIGAVFMSEEALRGQLAEMKLPKEAMGYVVNQADKTKREIIEVVGREARNFFGRLEVDKVVGKLLVGTTIEINTKIRILPKEGGGIGVSVEKNDTALVKTDESAPEERPRKRRKRRDEDGDD